MKVCSFLPAATHMMLEMELEKHLAGVTIDCPTDHPQVIRTTLEGQHYSSAEIDKIVSESAHLGKSLHYVDEELLQELQPDLIFTQDICNVCSVSTAAIQKAIQSLANEPKVVPLTPRRLRDVYDNALTIATELGDEKAGLDHLVAMQKRVRAVTDRLREHQAEPRRVMIVEWLDPIYNCGHWIPDQIALAGGVDMLSNPAGLSTVLTWEKIRQYDPEVLVIAPCGFQVERTLQEIDRLTSQVGWGELTAVKNEEVYVVNADYFTRPSTTLVDGIEILAALFHPFLFELSETNREQVVRVTNERVKV